MRKARKGETFRMSARTINAMVDAARHEANRGIGLGHHMLREHLDPGMITIKNASGGDCGRFEILGVDVPIYTPTDNEDTFKNQMGLEGVTPDVDDHTGLFVVLLEPIADGKIGKGLLSGICPVKVDVQDEADRWADVTDGETGYLTSGTRGAAQILWKEPGIGEKWAVVRVGVYHAPFAYRVAQSSADYAWLDESNKTVGNSGAFKLYYEDSGGSSAGNERRGIIKGLTLLGSDRPIRQLVMDLDPDTTLWERGGTVMSPDANPVTDNFSFELLIRVRPILVDPGALGDLTWNKAYVNGAGGGTRGIFDSAAQGDEGNLGTAASVRFAFDNTCHLTVTPNAPSGASAAVDLDTETPGLMVVKLSDMIASTWNAYSAIYGFEMRIAVSGENNQKAKWEAGSLASAVSECYALAKR